MRKSEEEDFNVVKTMLKKYLNKEEFPFLFEEFNKNSYQVTKDIQISTINRNRRTEEGFKSILSIIEGEYKDRII
jgi:hypothetical protein